MIPIHDDNPRRGTPVVSVALIVACVVVFLWQLSLGDAVQAAIYRFGLIPAVLFDVRQLPEEFALVPASATVLTSMFLHGGWGHLLGNMLYLWIFGDNVEEAMGRVRFIVFYAVCGIAAAMTQALAEPESVVPMIGASGAISGVLGAYLLLYPHARVLVVLPLGLYLHTMQLRAGWVLGFWFMFQIISSLLAGSQEGGGVAFGAHIGGFVAGTALVAVFRRPGVKLFAPARTRRISD